MKLNVLGNSTAHGDDSPDGAYRFSRNAAYRIRPAVNQSQILEGAAASIMLPARLATETRQYYLWVCDMPKPLRKDTFILLLAIICGVAMAANDRVCGNVEAIAAEREASTLRDWHSIYRSFQHFGHCDDASIAEGYSSSIAKVLSKNWQDFETLNRLIHQDEKFNIFVMKHVDET